MTMATSGSSDNAVPHHAIYHPIGSSARPGMCIIFHQDRHRQVSKYMYHFYTVYTILMQHDICNKFKTTNILYYI